MRRSSGGCLGGGQLAWSCCAATRSPLPHAFTDESARSLLLTTTCRHVVTIDGYADVPPNDAAALKKALSHQPVAVAVCASASMQFYASGVMDDKSCCQVKTWPHLGGPGQRAGAAGANELLVCRPPAAGLPSPFLLPSSSPLLLPL